MESDTFLTQILNRRILMHLNTKYTNVNLKITQLNARKYKLLHEKIKIYT